MKIGSTRAVASQARVRNEPRVHESILDLVDLERIRMQAALGKSALAFAKKEPRWDEWNERTNGEFSSMIQVGELRAGRIGSQEILSPSRVSLSRAIV